MTRHFRLLACFILAWGVVAHAGAQSLDTLKPDHPRVLAHAADFERIAGLVQSDALAKAWHAGLIDKAQAMLDEPIVKHELRDGRRLLYESREVLDRVLTLGMLDRIAPDDRYRDRIWADLHAAAAFTDWNPDHFLDVAEMALAFGLAYDWLYDRWTPAQRDTIRQAIVRHALKPAFAAYRQDVWWTRTHINWNQVCNGGLIAAALAIADEQPGEAQQMLRLGVNALKIPMARYAPDGGYQEGPGYWGFGTIYNVIALATLDSALGNDFGLSQTPGFSKTGAFPKHMTGATGLAYNFGDNRARPTRSAALFWLARRFNQPGYARFAIDHNHGSALDLLWYDPALIGPESQTPAGHALFKSAGAAAIRSGWTHQDWYIGAKGGWLDFGHAQMDLGSFILEHAGVRWLIDLGSDDYNLDGYFHSSAGGKRWDYYRNRAEGHNTLVVNPGRAPDQPYDATAAIDCTPDTIAIDLSKVYAGQAQRQITLDKKQNRVSLTDSLKFDKPAEVWWFAHTRAEVVLAADGRSAKLVQDGKAMRVELISPKGARLTLMEARPLPTSPDPKGQNPNSGAVVINSAKGSKFVKRGKTPMFGKPDPAHATRKLAIRLEAVTDAQIKVRFVPVTR